MHQVFTAAGEEAGSAGAGQVFSPVLDIARDPRWGRIVEGAGEDPYLGAAMARAQVLGFQGPRLGTPDRVLASVKRNWYAVMPESARLGDRGKVVLQFRIMKNGVVPEAEPAMVGSSGKDPLDRAAVSSIRASTPFEPLPPAFSGPFIELRFIFLYNLPLNEQ